MADFIAASTSYATHGEPMIPFYIFYSMFGWQRTADQMWQLGDQLGRGFLVGATAGRTTLTGEGLQHADGHSPVIAATNPAALSLRPGVRVRGRGDRQGRSAPDVRRGGPGRGPERLLLPDRLQRADAAAREAVDPGLDEGIVKGLYRFNTAESAGLAGRRRAAHPAARLRYGDPLGPGGAAAARRGVGRGGRRLVGDVLDASCGATRWTRDAALLRGEERVPYVRQALSGRRGAGAGGVSDYMRQVPDQIASGSSRTTRRWARTDSGCRTRATRRGGTSGSTRSRSSWRRWRSWPGGAKCRRRR